MLEIGTTPRCRATCSRTASRTACSSSARVRIGAGANVGRGAVLLYGADIGERAEVATNSVVMKHEMLLPGRRYVGCPTRAAGSHA